MTILVLGIGILLPLGLYLTLVNLDRMDLQQDEWGSISVFADRSLDANQVSGIADDLRARPGVAGVEVISPQQGMEEFQESSGFGASLSLLDENPLPWVIVVNPRIDKAQGAAIGEHFESLLTHIGSIEGVETVQADHKWLQRLDRLLALGRAAVTVLAVLFALAVTVVVANTIRLDVAARAEEIEILALVGAGNAFIRQPFLYSGFWYGLMGGMVAALLVEICLLYLGGPIGRLLDAYGQAVELTGLDARQWIALLIGSGLLGWAGAWVAVQRYLRQLVVGGTLGRR